MKKLLVLLFVLGAGFVVVSLRWPMADSYPASTRVDKVNRAAKDDIEKMDVAPRMTTVPLESPSVPNTSSLQIIASPSNVAPTTPLVKEGVQSNVPPRMEPVAGTSRGKEPLVDPLAREALGLVGMDVNAEEYWLRAINDPTLPAGERRDLIEDLNEEGFPDPRNPSVDDLPLIENRIGLIEWIWQQPQSQLDDEDPVKARALLEAYRDLWNMYDRLAGL